MIWIGVAVGVLVGVSEGVGVCDGSGVWVRVIVSAGEVSRAAVALISVDGLMVLFASGVEVGWVGCGVCSSTLPASRVIAITVGSCSAGKGVAKSYPMMEQPLSSTTALIRKSTRCITRSQAEVVSFLVKLLFACIFLDDIQELLEVDGFVEILLCTGSFSFVRRIQFWPR